MGRLVGRLGVGVALAWLVLVSVSCGAQGPPQFGQAFGGVDYPCALGAAVSNAVQHCAAHVVLVNHGGEGIGHVTLEVPLKDAKGSPTASNPTCGTSVPDISSGGNVDLVCNFDLPPGETVAGVPTVKSVDYVAAMAATSSGFDFGGAATPALAVAILLLAGAVLVAGPWRRAAAADGSSVVVNGDAAPASPAEPVSQESPPPSLRQADDAEYELPPLPR